MTSRLRQALDKDEPVVSQIVNSGYNDLALKDVLEIEALVDAPGRPARTEKAKEKIAQMHVDAIARVRNGESAFPKA